MGIPTDYREFESEIIIIIIIDTDGIDFVRDVLAFMCVVAAIVAVAFDGKVCLNVTILQQ